MGWSSRLNNCISNLDDLKKYLFISPEEEDSLKKIIKIHPLKVTKYYLSLIDKNNPKDPIKQMIIPSIDELDVSGSYDTSGEQENTKSVGLQHKYSQTALILSTSRCAAYCRFCFRKRLVGLSNKEILHKFNESIQYIKEHKEINNVLITGGDSFILPTKVIEQFLKLLSDISHLDFIRFASRVPVTFPHRILEDKKFLNVLKKYSSKKRIYVITHFNHPREITHQSAEAVSMLTNSNVIVNNQTVLLKGVNDDSNVLAELQNKLVRIGVNPYYVFQCRPVKRVKHHFQIPLYKGYKIVEEAKKKLNGHSKRFKYVMAHRTGKIEIVGIKSGYIYFKYLQAKNSDDIGKFFKRKLVKNASWLDDLN